MFLQVHWTLNIFHVKFQLNQLINQSINQYTHFHHLFCLCSLFHFFPVCFVLSVSSFGLQGNKNKDKSLIYKIKINQFLHSLNRLLYNSNTVDKILAYLEHLDLTGPTMDQLIFSSFVTVRLHLQTERHTFLSTMLLGCEFCAYTVYSDVDSSLFGGIPYKLCPIQSLPIYVDIN